MSTSTGAPAAFARSLGKERHDERRRGDHGADAADHAGRADQEAALALFTLVRCNASLNSPAFRPLRQQDGRKPGRSSYAEADGKPVR